MTTADLAESPPVLTSYSLYRSGSLGILSQGPL